MNKSEIKEVLIELKGRFESIFRLFDFPEDGLSPKENLKFISSQYSELKEYVNSYNAQLKKSKNLSTDQINFLVPAIREVALHCNARKGSMNKVELSSSLYDGSDYCSYYLEQLDV